MSLNLICIIINIKNDNDNNGNVDELIYYIIYDYIIFIYKSYINNELIS